MDVYDPQAKRTGRARQRYLARQNRRNEMASRPDSSRKSSRFVLPTLNFNPQTLRGRVALVASDLVWYATHKPQVMKAVGAAAALVFCLFVATHVLGGRIYPNVWALGVHLGDMTFEESQAALLNAWENEVRIRLLVDEGTFRAVPPVRLGMQLDSASTVEAARAVGMSGIPLGYGITPVVSVDYGIAQNYLLNLTQEVNARPFNAGYEWQGEELVGVVGHEGHQLDVTATMDTLAADPAAILEQGELALVMQSVAPEIFDPTPLLEDARLLASEPFEMTGYDPFTDEDVSWSTTREIFTSWLEAGPNGLTLREEAFAPVLEQLNTTLNPHEEAERFLEQTETMEKLAEAISNGEHTVHLRIRYRPAEYRVAAGDTGFRISRKTGIPFYLIQEQDPSRNWDVLIPGEMIQIPQRDVTVPLDPVPDKRIVVDLDTQTLWAFEDGQVVFNWPISSGIATAPTSPGIYQILNHDEVASGSSYTLCGDRGCAQWEMYYFMGIYEVQPGLMNGFHGAVLLPGGQYLGGGQVGIPYTYGCVMSREDEGRLLYEWADDGTIVEIVSSEFAPESDLARAVLNPGT